MNIEKSGKGENIDRSPQVEKNWREVKKRLEKAREVKQIGLLLDSILADPMYSGNELASVAGNINYAEMLSAAETLEIHANEILAETIRAEHGEDVGYQLNNDGDLELDNGLVYGASE